MFGWSRSSSSGRDVRRRGQDVDESKDSRKLRELRQELDDSKEELRREREKFQQLKEKTAGRKSRCALMVDDARERLRNLQSQFERDQQALAERKAKMKEDKEKNDEMLRKLRDQTNELDDEFGERRRKLEDLESLNKRMKEDLVAARLQRDKEQQELERLIGELEKIRARDASMFFSSGFGSSRSSRRRGSTRGGDDGERMGLVEEVMDKCKRVRDLVGKRYNLRENIRSKQTEILEAKQKIQEREREIKSVRDVENDVYRMASSVLRSLESSSHDNIMLGTTGYNEQPSQQRRLERYTTSTEHLERLVREVPDALNSFAANSDARALNPKYRSLITSLLQKLGLLMIQYNHQMLRLNGVNMNYSKQLIQLRSRNLQLKNDLEILSEEQAYELTYMLEQIPNLEKERERLRRSRDQIMEKFEQYKVKRIQLEKTIIQQEEDIKNSEGVIDEHRRLEERIAELRDQLEKNTTSMRDGDHSVANVAKFVMGDLKRAGMLGDREDRYQEGSESDYDPMATPRSDRGGGSPRDRDSPRETRGGGYDSPRETRGGPRGRSSSPPRGRSVSPLRDDSPHRYETRR